VIVFGFDLARLSKFTGHDLEPVPTREAIRCLRCGGEISRMWLAEKLNMGPLGAACPGEKTPLDSPGRGNEAPLR